jgi:uncharacterized protein (TIGR02266 family)
MRVIRLTFCDLRDLLSHYLEVTQEGGFFWSTRQELVEGEEVVLEIELPDYEEELSIQCRVMGSLRDKGLDVEPGYLLGFKPEETAKRERLLEIVGRNIIGSNRRFHRRYHKAMAVAWRTGEGEDMQVGHTVNVSLGGAFVRSDVLPPEDAEVTLHLRCGEQYPSITVNGRVAWTRVEGEQFGMGVQFLNLDPGQTKQLQKVLKGDE